MTIENLPVAVTMGDPAGIGGEIVLKAWDELHDKPSRSFFLIDDSDRIRRIARQLNLNIDIHSITDPQQTKDKFTEALPVLEEKLDTDVAPGEPNPLSAPSVVRSIDRAIEAVLGGEACAMLTNPIHKPTLYDAGFAYPGHTEYLAAQTKAERSPVMMIVSPNLRVVPATIHLSLRDAIDALSVTSLVECIETTVTSLRNGFGIDHPHIAVAGLNPHAGEDGHLGTEEIEIISPAIEKLCNASLNVSGPYPADTLFHETNRKNYHAVVCMYHDQALIPSKTLDFDSGVNTTLGLPIVRTSPDHGTAFDIAGTGKASPGSFIAALNLAHEMAAHRHNSVKTT
ncbi:MAG: 4-hydroxythreonine-4-phosphate dehydrogenase PdxA [Rhodospirillaceae bacterium]|nr:4-hydroxythreonine-4-phosphate dehydrogenase PdxA [Rhodospirillaceae bacterium]|tara:strand:+ start:1674 stop:2696 length:1023 start_codon:yes stop_codon:yes gene_type:complete